MISEASALLNNAPSAARALTVIIQVHVRAAQSMRYHPSTSEESKNIGVLLRQVRDDDLYYILDRAPEPGIKPFFRAELDRRRGDILAWLFRGILPNHTPDILTIQIVKGGGVASGP